MSYGFKPPKAMRDVNLAFPFQVAFRTHRGEHTSLMVEYCRQRSLEHRTRRDMRGLLRYCFARVGDAAGFATAFGGEQITVANGVANGPSDVRIRASG